MRGLSRKELSQKAKISLSTLNKIEAGCYYASLKVLIRLSESLDCDILQLFDQSRRELPVEDHQISCLYASTKDLEERDISLLCDLAEAILRRREVK